MSRRSRTAEAVQPAVPPDPFEAIDLRGRDAVVAAVSGGSDSLALLLLLADHLTRRAPAVRLVAVTVDHGLRPQSAGEAEAVAAFCAQRSIAHRTVRWTGTRPDRGIAAAARAARYRLLADAARAAGTDLVLTGHTRDDQAETVAMRMERGDARAQEFGLAGMAPATLLELGVWLSRPLLGVSRASLRRHLRAVGVDWIDDPSNTQPRYERARMRAVLQADGEARSNALLERAEQAAAARRALAGLAAAAIEAHAALPAPGLIRLDAGFIERNADGDDGAGRVHALRALLSIAGGAAFLPPRDRVVGLLDRLSGGARRASLAGAVADRRGDGLYLYRELRGAGPAPVPLADRSVWDRRYRLRGGAMGDDFSVGALGRERATAVPEDLAGEVPRSLLKAARAAGPALWRGGRCLGPLAGGVDGPGVAAEPVPAPWLDFLPGFDMALAAAAVKLIEGASLPPMVTGRSPIVR